MRSLLFILCNGTYHFKEIQVFSIFSLPLFPKLLGEEWAITYRCQSHVTILAILIFNNAPEKNLIWNFFPQFYFTCRPYYRQILVDTNGRSSRLKMFFKTGALKNYAIFTGEHLCWNFFLKKILQLYQKRDSGTGAFP